MSSLVRVEEAASLRDFLTRLRSCPMMDGLRLNGRRVHHAIPEARTKAQAERADVSERETKYKLYGDVSNALVQYRRVKEIRPQQELLVTSLRDASRLAHLRYEGGVDTLLNALVADTSLFNAELSLAQTKRNELLSLVQLYKALGGG
jgi:multidrug efflux system outer membrane protein